MFITSKADTEFAVDSTVENITYTVDIVGFLTLFLLCTF